jgi:TRAP-type mannitol/chloroaromatic compound transport system substrate-binding protein
MYVNKKALESLPAEYRAILEAACNAAHVLTQAKYDHLNPIALKELIGQGATLRAFPRSVLDALYKATNEVLDEQAAKNTHFKKILDTWRPYQRDISNWFVIGEQVFDSYVSQTLRTQAAR